MNLLKSVFFASHLYYTQESCCRPRNLFGLVEAWSYEVISFSLLKDRSQLVTATAIVTITCKAIRRFGKTVLLPYLSS